MGHFTRGRDVRYFLQKLPQVVGEMRQNPPAYHNENIFISQQAFRKHLENSAPLQIIDIRPIKYPRYMIPGSIHIPPRRLEKELHKLDQGMETILICYHGDILSPEAQMLLTRQGFGNVRVLKGGFFGYESVAS